LKHELTPRRLTFLVPLAIAGCSTSAPPIPTRDAGVHDSAVAQDAPSEAAPPPQDATVLDVANEAAPTCDASVPPDAGPPSGAFCALPGSVLWTGDCASPHLVPGAPAGTPDLSWLKLPAGFCAHYFGKVGDARQLRFAPGGELFVASPTSATTGGNPTFAVSGIVVLPDDNHDGFADPNITFLTGLPSIQGLLFANGAFYYQDDTTIRSVAYKAGDRQPSATPQAVVTITVPQATEHWPKVMDISMGGKFYITNGGSQAEFPTECVSSWPARGSVLSLEDGGTTSVVSMGYRNPIALRCEKKHDVCLATELALDYSAEHGGREKLVPIRQGDNWGYPCCATKDLPYVDSNTGLPVVFVDGDGGVADCSHIAPETDSFVIGNTPFGLDFETGVWPAPWTDRVFVTLHGAAGSWSGARVVSIALDPTTGLPLPGTELQIDGGSNSLLQFATGWDDGMHAHGRPAPITFAPDGRMFLGDDNNGFVVWIAPIDLKQN
jgi:glucose/arabinose dehydrogenase